MNAEQHTLAHQIALVAADLPEEDSEAYLREASGGDPEVLAEARRRLDLGREPAGDPAVPPAPVRCAGPAPAEPDPTLTGALPRAERRRYTVVEKLGAGGMGVVYRAIDRRLDRPVALKHLRRAQASEPRALRRFEREAKAAAKLSHPAIVQIHDILSDQYDHWIVMELVPGRSLARLLADGPLAPGTAIPLAAEIAGALAEAHAHGIVHRDLKSSNVMVTPAGRAKVLDFGLAKPLVTDEDDLTLSGALLGTPKAMSPEQVVHRRVDARSDLFSLGALLFEMVTGEAPFQGANLVETLEQVCRFRPLPASQLDPRIPEDLSSLIEALLEKDPAHRPQEAAAVARGLARMAESLTQQTVTGAHRGTPRERSAGEPGARSDSDVTSGSGERRQITVLSCQLMAASGGTIDDPEELLAIRPAFQNLAGRVIERFGGHLGQQLDDGIMAFFGFPAASGDDPRRAVAAALEILCGIEDLNARLDRESTTAVTLRIGVHAGPAVTSRDTDGGPQLFLGKTGSFAAAIKNLADPETLVVSAEAHRMIAGSFRCEDLGAFRLSGWEEPATVYRVLAPGGRHRHAAVRSSGELFWEAELDRLRYELTLDDENGVGDGRAQERRGADRRVADRRVADRRIANRRGAAKRGSL